MPHAPIVIGTFAALRAHGFRLDVWCECGHGGPVDLDKIIASGKGAERYVGRRFKCSKCGALAHPLVSGAAPGVTAHH